MTFLSLMNSRKHAVISLRAEEQTLTDGNLIELWESRTLAQHEMHFFMFDIFNVL